MQAYQEALKRIDVAQHIAVCIHRSPDGDCI